MAYDVPAAGMEFQGDTADPRPASGVGERIGGGSDVKSFVAVFTTSALFGAAIWVVYWFVAHHEAAGAVLLGVMTIALTFATLYALLAERDANLEGDAENAAAQDWAGDDLGIYTRFSAYPVLLAACIALGLLAMLWSPLIALFLLAAFVLCLWRLGAESSRR